MSTNYLSIQYFEKLGLPQRLDVLYKWGSKIASLDYFSNYMQLWMLGDFYVELFLSRGNDKVVMAEPLDNSRAHCYVEMPEASF